MLNSLRFEFSAEVVVIIDSFKCIELMIHKTKSLVHMGISMTLLLLSNVYKTLFFADL